MTSYTANDMSAIRDKYNTKWDTTVLPVTEGEYMSLDEKSSYYDAGGMEVFTVMLAKMTPEQLKGYYLGNVIKYSLRLNWKGSSERDAEKLANYSRLLKECEHEC